MITRMDVWNTLQRVGTGVVLAMLFAACDRSAAGGRSDSPSVADSAGVRIVQHGPIDGIPTCIVTETTFSTMVGGGTAGQELSRVFDVTSTSSGGLVLINGLYQRVQLHAASGTLRMASGRVGAGPGEFQNPFHVFVTTTDTIWVTDFAPWRFLILNPDGKWNRTVTLFPIRTSPPDDVFLLDDQRSVWTETRRGAASTRLVERQIMAKVHAPDGRLVDSLGPFATDPLIPAAVGSGRGSTSPMFGASTHVVAEGSRVHVASGRAAEILSYTVDGSGRLERIVRWTASPRRVRPADIEAERARLQALMNDARPELRERMYGSLLDEARPHAPTFPLVTDLRAGGRGALWVKNWVEPGPAEPAVWMRIGPDGTIGCRAPLPAGGRVGRFLSDHLLMIFTDSSGFESVRRFEVRLPDSAS